MEKDHLEIIREEMNSKFDIVIEGHQTLHNEIIETRTELKKDIEFLNFKIDTVNDNLSQRMDNLETNLTNKIDAVAADLKAHRNDTEAHQIYRVKEG